MTPLAQAIVKETLLPPRKRTFQDKCGLLDAMSDIHCFEVSEVIGLARELVRAPGMTTEENTARFAAMAERTSFLPAPRTWIEWSERGMRVGYLLVERDGWAEVRVAVAKGSVWGADEDRFSMALFADADGHIALSVPQSMSDERAAGKMEVAIDLHSLLALINSPRVVGRREVPPHRGLVRAVAATPQGHGGFVLHPWTTINLEVNAQPNGGEAETKEGRLTGHKALHFCRAHLRLRRGRVEIVRSHWRGDAAIGMKRSRYAVVPPRAAA